MSTISRINANDHGGKLVLAVALMLAYTIIVYATRLQIKWPWKAGTFKSEDFLLLGAIVLSIAYSGVVCTAIQHGMGQHVTVLSNGQIVLIRKTIMSSILLARVVESLSLVSLASFIKKMSTVIIHKRLLVIIYVITAAWLCIALVVEGIEVGAANVNRTASIVLGVVPAIILVTLFATMIHMIWTTSMRTHRKIFATLWLLLIPCVAAFIIVRIVRIPSPPLDGDFTFTGIHYSIWLTIEMNFCIISAAYVSFMRFARNATTGFMGQMLPPEATTYDASKISSPPKTESLNVTAREVCESDSEHDSERRIILIQKSVTIEHADTESIE